MRAPESCTEALLSICIPTYNRKDSLVGLLTSLCEQSGSFEICVHDDGSTDGTAQLLDEFAKRDFRVKVTSAANAGRAQALKLAVQNAAGKFTMIYDDDDEIDPSGFVVLMKDLEAPLPQGVAGYIYQMGLPGRQWAPFPFEVSNFLKLRADDNVQGDKKEVVRTTLIQAAVSHTPALCRRAPTSYFWAQIATQHDVICRNVQVGSKFYGSKGLSANIRHIKLANAQPMVLLHKARLKGFLRRRYRSTFYAIRSAIGVIYYSVVARLSNQEIG